MQRSAGYTYLGVLLFVALSGVVLAAAGRAWHSQAMREREEELLFAGDQYRRAIASYFAASPGQARYPRSLAELLKDPRHPGTVRHLRRLYPDPVAGGEWGLVPASDGGIAGVHSLSAERPFRISGFSRENAQFEGSQRYSDWRFEHARPTGSGGIQR